MFSRLLSRRDFLQAAAACGFLAAGRSARTESAGTDLREFRLRAQFGRQQLVPDGYPATDVWTYGGSVPGPEIRIRHGERLRVTVDNALAQETTVHWHGIRLPNAMDGVAGLTQAPIRPGERFVYEFTPPDAGTYWYHPHVNGSEQVGRGLYGALIVEERAPILVDRELTWVLDDWRLTSDAAVREDFGNGHDRSHAGRLGNTVTVNGRIPDSVAVRSGQRVRLRLVNVSNARNFALRFESHEPIVIAIDGQPVAPHRPPGGTLVLGAAMRIDVVLDCALDPGSESRVIDTFYPDRAFLLTTLAYGPEATVDTGVRNKPVSLSPNPLGEPILDAATEHEIVLAGGAMGGLRGAMLDGRWADMRRLVDEGIFWTMGGVARHPDAFTPPMLTLSRGSSHVVTLRNETAFPHPIHLHGHHFRVLSRNGETTPFTPWQDSVLVASREQVRIAFRADNPGDWLFHCHVLEHMAAGMSGVVRVL